MSEDRIAGAAQQMKGQAQQEAGRLTDDPGLELRGAGEHATGETRDAAGRAQGTTEETAPSPEEELRALRAEVDRIEAERAAANARVASRLRKADAALHQRTDAAAELVRSHPLLAVLGAAGIGLLLGRLTGGTIHHIDRDD